MNASRALIGDQLVAEVGRQASQKARCHRAPEMPSNAGSVTGRSVRSICPDSLPADVADRHIWRGKAHLTKGGRPGLRVSRRRD
jgi:hypothetical protein